MRPCGKANAFRFREDDVIQINPKVPLVLYRSPIRLSGQFDPAAVFKKLFDRNGGVIPGGMAFTITRIIHPAFMKPWALPR